MNPRSANLLRAARLIRRLDSIPEMDEFDGARLSDIALDCQMAAGSLIAQERVEEALWSVKVTNVVPLRSA